jgi:hypothetical protein
MDTATVILDRLPPPPSDEPMLAGPGILRGSDARLLAIVKSSEAAVAEHEQYVKEVVKVLKNLRAAAEGSEFTEEELSSGINELIDRERKRRTQWERLIGIINEHRALRAKIKKSQLRNINVRLEDVINRIERSTIRELEAYRDARLCVERVRAGLINRREGAGPVFDSGEEAAAFLRALRK